MNLPSVVNFFKVQFNIEKSKIDGIKLVFKLTMFQYLASSTILTEILVAITMELIKIRISIKSQT